MKLTFANKITICRIFSVPFFLMAVFYHSTANDYFRYIALAIFGFAVISDFIDGYIARTRNQKSKAGAILDPLADKLLLISAFWSLFSINNHFMVVRLPAWLVILVVSRDIILILGFMIIYSLNGDIEIRPTIFGKLAAFFQMSAIIGFLLQMKAVEWLFPVTFIFIVISGVDYIRKGIVAINAGGK